MNYTQNEKIEQVTDSTMVVGVDIGSQIHYARAFDNRGRELTKRIFSFHNDLEGFNSFSLWAETLKTENKKIAVLIRDLVYSRDGIMKQHNISANRIQRWLAIHFPEYLGLYTRFDAISGLAVLEKAPLPKDVIALGVNGIRKIWHDKKMRGRGVTEDRAMTIITSVSQLATLPLQGICQGGQPIMSYNYGAGNRDRVKKAFFTQFTVCTIFTGCFWLIMLLFPKMFAGIFSNNTELITYTAWALRIYMAGIFSLGFQVACQQSFMALGQAKVSLLLACLRKLILLIPLIFILPHFIQNKVFAVFLAEPISDILAAIITTSTFFSQFNKILDRK